MLRPTFLLRKVTRSWTKSSISAASAHFPDGIKVDPASQRGANTTAKETRCWTLTEKAVDAVTVRELPKPLQSVVSKIKLYGELVRFDRPVGWQLLLIPCYWGSALAVTKAMVWEGADPVVLCAPFIPLHLAIYFFAGAYLMRSVGCIVNDMWDRKFGRMVERTANRPLASGAMTMGEASFALVTHLGAAGIIALNLSPVALATCLAVTPLWIIYPFMKRITYAPQLVLGMCFNWGIFVGYAAVLGRVDLAVCLPIYIGAVFWTIIYDTIYAYQDSKDDVKCGVKSTALWFGDRKYILNAMIPIMCAGLLFSGLQVSQSLPYYIGILMCMYRLHTIIDDVNVYDGWSCAQGFKRNARLGFYIFLAMCAGNFLWTLASEHEPEKDAAHDTTGSTSLLSKYVFFDNHTQGRYIVPEGINWLDRLIHPVYVHAEAAKARGDTEPPAVPAWMRREYIGENLTTILRFLGMPEEKLTEFTTWWYSLLDHYNMFSKVQL